MRRLLVTGVAVHALAALAALDGAGATEILPLEQVQPGMRVVARTVFAGSRIEPFEGKVLGVARNFMGPQRHIIMVQFEGERLYHTGIAQGMSGSPVYVDGKLIGALSLGFSPFPKDPVAGVTPIEYMLAESEDQTVDFTGGAPPAPALGRQMTQLQPLKLPLLFRGVQPEVFRAALPYFERFPVAPILGGGGGGGGSGVEAAPIEAGAPIAAVLVSGDLGINGVGTVTYVAGDRVWAFGHPFLSLGKLSMPMAGAEIITTLADQSVSYKVSNTGDPVGTLEYDRSTAVAGRLGPVPPMIPMAVSIERAGAPSASYHYRVFRHPALTPILVAISLLNSVAQRWQFDLGATLRFDLDLELAAVPAIHWQQTFVTDPASGLQGLLPPILELLQMLNQTNEVRPRLDLERVEASIRIDPQVRRARIRELVLEAREARAGQSIGLRVELEREDTGRSSRYLSFALPSDLNAGTYQIEVAGGADLDQREGQGVATALALARDGTELSEALNAIRRRDRLYVRLTSDTPALRVAYRRMDQLPPSILSILAATGNSAARPANRSVIAEQFEETDGVVEGYDSTELIIRPRD
jgi:hypothetical protein